jgi:NAD(P)-dependent dehydrogenase (short-subunit alcohol dehydrogenase family)
MSTTEMIDQSKRLKGKTCLVTGAASGIGKGTAEVLAAQGARVVLADLNGDGLAETAVVLGESTAGHASVDLSDEAAVTSFFDDVVAPLGALDAVVCAHGYLDLDDGLLESHQTEIFDNTLNINLRGVYFVTRASIPWLKAAGSGSIVLVSSLAALRTPSSIAYGASKGALNAMGKTISGQYAAEGIRCNVICPGAIDTPMLQRAMAKRNNAEPPNNHARRIGIPYDVGYLAAFLCSEESGFITATVHTVDGGVAQH